MAGGAGMGGGVGSDMMMPPSGSGGGSGSAAPPFWGGNPSTGNSIPMLSGPSSTGPMPPTGQGPMPPAMQPPQPFSGIGQSAQAGQFNGMSSNPQPPNPGGQQTGMGPSGFQSANTRQMPLGPPQRGSVGKPATSTSAVGVGSPLAANGMGPAAIQAQVAQPNGMMPPQRGMRVHNPTGVGADQASQMAAAQRPNPGNYPKKAQGPLGPPTPLNIPGKPA